MTQNIITHGFSCETVLLSSGEILDVYPSQGSIGIATGSSITVIFDQEMDLSSINSGTFLLYAPNTSDIFGPTLEAIEQIGAAGLSSSNYISSLIEYYKVDSDNNIIESDIFDTSGDGTLWKTLAVLKPLQALLPNVSYKVVVSGDESSNNGFSSGVKTRNIFDPVKAVVGTGEALFSGGYTGTSTSTYSLEILEGGATGTATYRWWNTASPLVIKEGITTTGTRLLEKGISVFFESNGTFETGDRWTVLCKPSVSYGSSASWSFTTGSGSIVTPPSTSSTSGILGVTPSTSITNLSGFEVSRVVPAPGKYGVEIKDSLYDRNEIVLTFGGTSLVSEDSLTGAISLKAEHALGEDSIHTAFGDLEFEATLVDSVLTILIDPDQLQVNNIVVLTLDRTIENEDGDTLGEDYITYFSTPYTPLYTSRRRISLDVGPAIRNIQEEPIMLAILEASLYADSLNFQNAITNANYYQHARREFVTCYAEGLLLNGLLSSGEGGRLSKTLGDLKVSRDGAGGISQKAQELKDCFSYWEIVLTSGGAVGPNMSLSPGHSVKGALSNDTMITHRQWEPMSYPSVPAANSWRQNPRGSSRKGTMTYRRKNGWR